MQEFMLLVFSFIMIVIGSFFIGRAAYKHFLNQKTKGAFIFSLLIFIVCSIVFTLIVSSLIENNVRFER
jgi:biotin transporter BioY